MQRRSCRNAAFFMETRPMGLAIAIFCSILFAVFLFIMRR